MYPTSFSQRVHSQEGGKQGAGPDAVNQRATVLRPAHFACTRKISRGSVSFGTPGPLAADYFPGAPSSDGTGGAHRLQGRWGQGF